MTLDEYAKEENRINLKQKLRNAQRSRSGAMKQEMTSLKRSVPDKILKHIKIYLNLVYLKFHHRMKL